MAKTKKPKKSDKSTKSISLAAWLGFGSWAVLVAYVVYFGLIGGLLLPESGIGVTQLQMYCTELTLAGLATAALILVFLRRAGRPLTALVYTLGLALSLGVLAIFSFVLPYAGEALAMAEEIIFLLLLLAPLALALRLRRKLTPAEEQQRYDQCRTPLAIITALAIVVYGCVAIAAAASIPSAAQPRNYTLVQEDDE